MPQENQKNQKSDQKVSPKPRNESAPGKTPVGTTTPEELNSDNSSEVRDALNESQL